MSPPGLLMRTGVLCRLKSTCSKYRSVDSAVISPMTLIN